MLQQHRVFERPNWVYEGFNLPSLPQQVKAADRIIFLEKSHIHITWNYIKRLRQYRHIARPDMPSGNAEHFSMSYVAWLWKYSNKEVLQVINKYAQEKPLIVLKSQRSIDMFLNDLSSANIKTY